MSASTTADVLAGRALWAVECGDALGWLRGLPDGCVDCCVTSPPYFGLRDYGAAGQIGLEPTPGEYVERLVAVFREVRRAMRGGGSLWLNLGDSYAGGGGGNYGNGKSVRSQGGQQVTNVRNRPTWMYSAGFKPKDLLGIPWRVAFALQADGWYLRQWLPWVKRNPMPESVTDRPGSACEVVFLLSKRADYFFDAEAVKRAGSEGSHGGGVKGKSSLVGNGHSGLQCAQPAGEGGRNFRNADLWFDSVGLLLAGESADPLGLDVTTKPYKGAHFAVMPPGVVEPCVLAGTSARGVCPHCGGPWVRLVERERKATRPGTDSKVTGVALTDGNRDPQRHVTATATVGWAAGCECPDNAPVPAVVLDPFSGSGTTQAVAVSLGRRAVGCELNPDYLPLIRRRLSGVTPPLPFG